MSRLNTLCCLLLLAAWGCGPPVSPRRLLPRPAPVAAPLPPRPCRRPNANKEQFSTSRGGCGRQEQGDGREPQLTKAENKIVVSDLVTVAGRPYFTAISQFTITATKHDIDLWKVQGRRQDVRPSRSSTAIAQDAQRAALKETQALADVYLRREGRHDHDPVCRSGRESRDIHAKKVKACRWSRTAGDRSLSRSCSAWRSHITSRGRTILSSVTLFCEVALAQCIRRLLKRCVPEMSFLHPR